MRRQNDDQLRSWAHLIKQRIEQDGQREACLVYRASPGIKGAACGHVENNTGMHLLEMEDITRDDLTRLGELLQQEGLNDVTVKQANDGGHEADAELIPAGK